MATQDDDTLTGSVPDPEIEPTPTELSRARRFAELVDKTLSGRTPPAMSADDRALLEVATVIRATHGNLELAPGRQHAVVEDALRQAIGAASSAGGSVASLAGARARAQRWTPWIIAGASTLVAAAAIALLWLRPSVSPAPVARPGIPGIPGISAISAIRVEWTSRSADSLIGPIAPGHAGDAGARIDTIFADRLEGYRSRRLARGGKP